VADLAMGDCGRGGGLTKETTTREGMKFWEECWKEKRRRIYYNIFITKFGYKLICSYLTVTYYVATYKII
jgi:hypothetical protein